MSTKIMINTALDAINYLKEWLPTIWYYQQLAILSANFSEFACSRSTKFAFISIK